VDIAIAAITGGDINMKDIIEKIGKTAVDLANAICDHPNSLIKGFEFLA
jgi:hypothetical protein